ncbi:MAG: sensor histidine kinase [Bacteroidia bacterium]
MDGFQGQEVTILIAVGIVVMLGMAIALVAFYGKAQRKLLAQQLEAKERVLQGTIVAQEEERSRIAKDLHDDIGSKLNVIFLHTQRLKKGKADPQPIVEEITEILNTTIDTTRRISHELLPPTLQKFGLSEAIKELCSSYAKTGFMTFDLQLHDLEKKVTDDMLSLNLFRVLQELIKNSIHHGQARNIMIHFVPGEQQQAFRYKDDGKGFDKAAVEQRKGLGMNNVESRIKMIGGDWIYDSAPGEGLRAEIAFGS